MSGITAATVTAAAAVASAGYSVVSGLTNKPKAPTLPTPQVPAVPAAMSRNDAGSQILVGSDNVKNQRVGFGGNAARINGSSVQDVLGGLGAGGINI